MSWLSKNVIDPLKRDVAAFFGLGSPVSNQVKSSVAAIGSTTLEQVDPVVTTAESGLEALIDDTLVKLGPIGAIGVAGVQVVYPLLAEALNNVIAEKLGVPAPAAPAGPGSPAAPAAAAAAE